MTYGPLCPTPHINYFLQFLKWCDHLWKVDFHDWHTYEDEYLLLNMMCVADGEMSGAGVKNEPTDEGSEEEEEIEMEGSVVKSEPDSNDDSSTSSGRGSPFHSMSLDVLAQVATETLQREPGCQPQQKRVGCYIHMQMFIGHSQIFQHTAYTQLRN